MSNDLFSRIKYLLKDHISLLNKHSIGDTHVEQAEVIVEEIEILLKSNQVEKIEQTIDEVERQIVSEDIADEILNGKHCVGSSCDD